MVEPGDPHRAGSPQSVEPGDPHRAGPPQSVEPGERQRARVETTGDRTHPGDPGDGDVLVFLDVMRRLRAECPWKAAQTHRSLARYLLEEAHETLEALDTGDRLLLREELGDLLLQVFLHTAIAEQAGEFTTADVARDVTEKMYRRNPHVFAEDHGDLDPAAVNELWESRKAAEKQRSSVTEGLAPGLPALLYADKVLDRLARSGAEVDLADTADTADTATDLGDRLLALVAEARASGTDPEQALRDAVRRRLP